MACVAEINKFEVTNAAFFCLSTVVISTIIQSRHQTLLAIPQDPNRKQLEGMTHDSYVRTEPINGDILVGGREFAVKIQISVFVY